jgi:hypothetical protein
VIFEVDCCVARFFGCALGRCSRMDGAGLFDRCWWRFLVLLIILIVNYRALKDACYMLCFAGHRNDIFPLIYHCFGTKVAIVLGAVVFNIGTNLSIFNY